MFHQNLVAVSISEANAERITSICLGNKKLIFSNLVASIISKTGAQAARLRSTHKTGGSLWLTKTLDVAALAAAAILRKNPTAEVIPFSDTIVKAKLNPRDSVMTNAQKLASLPSGGTNCSAPLVSLNAKHTKGDLVIYVSDNQSWIDSKPTWNSGTETMKQWNAFKSRNKDAKLVCIDIQPYAHTQAQERTDILNVGGFSDQVFNLITEFADGTMNANHWVGVIEKVEI